jgi:hypothetical protein
MVTHREKRREGVGRHGGGGGGPTVARLRRM